MAQTLNYRPKSYPGLLRLTFYLKTRPNWSGHFVLIKKKHKLGHARVGLSKDLKRAHIIRPRKKLTWQFVELKLKLKPVLRSGEWKSQQIKSNQIQTRLKPVLRSGAEILHLRRLLLSLSLLFAFALSVHTAIPPMLNSSGISQNHTLKIHFSLPITRACRFCSGMN